MKIDLIKLHRVQVPFMLSIDHHLKKRGHSDSIVLAIHTQDGKIGYGEGAPRSYVTGESIQDVLDTFQKAYTQHPITEIHTLDDIDNWCNLFIEQYQMPAIAAALEIALLDLLGQEQQCSLGSFLNQEQKIPTSYSAVLPFLSAEKLDRWLELIKSLELSQLKMKVGHPDDLLHIAKVRQVLGHQIDIRVDANRAWTFEEAVQNIKALHRFNITCVEEPLQASEVSRLPALGAVVDTPLLLDESVYTLEQANFFARKIDTKKLLFNLKISKSGGLRRAAEIYHFAKSKGIECQLGCNVGETAILSAAGRIFAQTHQLIHLEGSFAPFFMADDISTEPVAFSKKGIGSSITGNGLGISIDPKKLQKYSSHIEVLNPGFSKAKKPLGAC